MKRVRVDCPGCGRQVAITQRRRLYPHGRPECPKSGQRTGKAWPPYMLGARVRTVPGPDTWEPPVDWQQT